MNARVERADVSVITVVRNDRDGLRRTAASVVAQRGCSIEYIVIDGASTDGTVDEIVALGKAVARWESRADGGIYDAMNRGVALARGEWLLFLNAGDALAADDVLARLMEAAEADDGVVYGDHYVREDTGRLRYKRARPAKDLWRGMVASHQSTIVRRRHAVQHPYEAQLRIAGDFAFFAALQRTGVQWRRVPTAVAVMERGGVSDVQRFRSLGEWAGVAVTLAPRTRVLPYYAWRILWETAQLPLRMLRRMRARGGSASRRRSAGKRHSAAVST